MTNVHKKEVNRCHNQRLTNINKCILILAGFYLKCKENFSQISIFFCTFVILGTVGAFEMGTVNFGQAFIQWLLSSICIYSNIKEL